MISGTVRYQVFVSSTYNDLEDERDRVVRAILEMGHIPVGMEMFSAGDDSQWELIKRQIEATDYYVVLLAHRYGTLDGPISYTEKEYDYAVHCGVPSLGFVLQPGASWPADRVDKDPSAVTALDIFKEKVKRKLVSFWTSADDLQGKVSIALMKQMVATPREGWVRASGSASPRIVSELARLSEENKDLREALGAARENTNLDIQIARAKTIATLQANKFRVSIYYAKAHRWTPQDTRTLYELFFLLAPELMIERSIDDLAALVARVWRRKKRTALRPKWPFPANTLKARLTDLAVLNLVEPSSRSHAPVDEKQYWTLTSEGRSMYSTIRRARLEAGIPLVSESDDQSVTVGTEMGQS